MLWFALLLPDLPLQVFLRGSDDEHTPFAVVTPRPAARVVVSNPAAVAQGVRPGTGRASALALVPDLQLKERDPALEGAALEEIARCALRYTPQVCLDPPNAVLLEAQASLRLFGGVEALAAALAADLAQLGFTPRIAAAPTPLAARWLAMENPGSHGLALSGLPAILDDLPMEVLGQGTAVSAPDLELLAGMGARRIAEVRRLPRDGLARRTGQEVMDALDRAYGLRPDPRPSFIPPEDYASHLALPTPSSNTETVLFAGRRLLAGLASWLAARHGGIESFRLVLEHEDAPDHSLEIVLGVCCREEARFVLLLREHLTRLELAGPVEAIRLEAPPLQRLESESGSLFETPDTRPGDPALLLATLRARLGDEAVYGLAVHGDHRPEHSWRRVEPQPPRPIPPSRRKAAAPDIDSAPVRSRPLWLLPQPQPLPGLAGHTLLAGPERIESGWWDGAPVRRDYYIARDAGGTLAWLFRPLDEPEHWYVHGYFA